MAEQRCRQVLRRRPGGLALNDDAALRERLQTAGLRVTAVGLLVLVLVLKTLSGLNAAVSHADIDASLPPGPRTASPCTAGWRASWSPAKRKAR